MTNVLPIGSDRDKEGYALSTECSRKSSLERRCLSRAWRNRECARCAAGGRAVQEEDSAGRTFLECLSSREEASVAGAEWVGWDNGR